MTLDLREGEWRMRDGNEEVELVRKAQIGDLGAFDRLARRYRPAAILTAQNVLRQRDRAEDAAQDGLVAAYKALPRLADPQKFGSWLAAIVRNRAIRLQRGERAEPMPVDRLIVTYAPSIQSDLEEADGRTAVHCAIADLPEELQTAVRLYYLHEWSVGAIAEYASLPITTVKWRLHEGRRRLRRQLQDEFEEKS